MEDFLRLFHAFADETGEVLVAGKLPTPDADRLHIRNRRSGASLELPLGGLRPRQPREITLAEMLARASGPVLAIAIAGPGVSWRVELSRHDQPDLVRVDVKLDRPGGLPWPLSVWNAPSAQSWGVLLTQVTRLVASI